MGWTTLPRNYLEQEFDSLGLERNFETGIEDTAKNVEKLSDYLDRHLRLEDDLGPEYAKYPLLQSWCPRKKYVNPCPGSRQSIDGDQPVGKNRVRCSMCSRVVSVYPRKDRGMFKSGHEAACST